MRSAPALLVACVAVTLSRGALASPSARLVYSRTTDAASCPDESALRKAVAARVGYDPFFPWAKVTVFVEISRHHGAFAARVEILDEQGVARGTRELSSTQDGCVEIFDATALAISIALDASGPPPPEAPPAPVLTPAPTPSAPLVTESEPKAEPAAQAVAEATPSPPPPRRLLFAGVDVLGSTGAAPSVSVGGAAFVGARARFVSVALELRVDAPASAGVPGGGSVTSWLYAGSLVPCAHYSILSLCAVGALGSLQGSARARESLPTSTLFAAAGGRLGVEWELTQTLALRAHVDLLRNLAPTELTIDGSGWPAPSLMESAGAGVVVRFP